MHKSPIIMPMLPGFYLPKRGRKARSAQKVFADHLVSLKQKSFRQIGEIFQSCIPARLLKPEANGIQSRRRIFSKENTFWAFFGQILDADGGCKEVVRKMQSFASSQGMEMPSSSTASYCKARKRMGEETLIEIFRYSQKWVERTEASTSLQGRRVLVVDGTGISMTDTEANQQVWPQSASQKPGCGFPSGRICACFSLETGALLSYAVGNKKSSELPLFRTQWSTFATGDIFLGDKGFCSYYDIAKLKERGVDSVVTLARRKPVNPNSCIREFAPDDLLIAWQRPKYNKLLSYDRETLEELSEQLLLRQIRVKVRQPGFRTKEFYIVTTLTDPVKYTKSEIAELYLRRWAVELFFRDIKTTMGFDILRCQSPEMVRKEILMYFIAYNCIRRIMFQAAEARNVKLRTISFKGSLQAIRNWAPRLSAAKLNNIEKRSMLTDLTLAVASCKVFDRPGRSDPRCIKRRLKPYQLLTKPRGKMVEIQHRSRYEKMA